MSTLIPFNKSLKKEVLLSAVIISIGLIFSVSNIALALSDDINYPIKDLGNCQNEKECRAYCDKPENMSACVAFSEKNNLISREDAKLAENFMSAKNKPGNCKDQKDCESYCNDISRIDECVAFAEKNNLMTSEELGEAKKIQGALKQGAKMPGGCKNKEQCDAYCESSNHMEECIDFAVNNGIMEGKDLEEAQKMLQAVKKGAKPPACRNKKECDAYCGEEIHFEECIAFAEAAGFVSKEEAQMIKKTGGKGPGGCKGREECDAFCGSSEENMMSCAEFALGNGMMTKEDFEMMKKTGGKGPGGCKGREECEAFCQSPDNQETCFQFGRDNGLIPEEELKKMEEGKQQFQKSFENMPAEVADCISQKVGPEMLAKFQSGTIMPTRNAGESMRECFEKMGPPPGQQCEGENCPPPGEGQGMFNRARGFINQMMPGNSQNPAGGGTSISIKKDSSGYHLVEIRSSAGIKSFSLTSDGSTPYSGDLSGCPNEYKNTTVISFPVKAVITDCQDKQQEFTIASEGESRSAGQDQGMRQEIRADSQQKMTGPGGCKSPQECEEFCKNNQKECMNFGPAGGQQQICEGENCPPSGEAQPRQGEGVFDRARNFIRQMAPGTREGSRPNQPPCEGDNCPPPGEMGPPNENRQEIREGEDRYAPPGEGERERESERFEGDDRFRIPSPDEINQIQERMMRENEGVRYMEQRPADGAGSQQREPQPIRPEMPIYEQREIQMMPGTSGGFVPPANIGPAENYQPQIQLNQPVEFQRPLENIPPPPDNFQPPINYQQSPPPPADIQPPQPTSFKLATDKALANVISELIYSPNCKAASTLCVFKQSAQNQISDLISDKIYPPARLNNSSSLLHNLRGELQNEISELIARNIYDRQ